MEDLLPPTDAVLTRARFASNKWPVFAGGVRWFPRLNDTESEHEVRGKKVRRVERGASSEKIPGGVVLSWQMDDAPGVPKRVFGNFASPLEVSEFVGQVVPSERTFFEVCRGPRLLFFDVDISGAVADELEAAYRASAADVAERIVAALVAGTVEVAAAALPPVYLRPAKDFRVYESHGPTKRSYHVVVSRQASTAAIAKEWYDAVLASPAFTAFADFPRIRNVVDSAVYSSTQQLRLSGSQKSGSGRVKTLRHSVPTPTGDVEIQTHHFESEQHRANVEFIESFVSRPARSLPLISSQKTSRPRPRAADLPEGVEERALALAAEHGDFDFARAEGDVIFLNRRAPSKCPTCGVLHEAENPFLTLAPRDGGYDVRFFCRRAEAHGAPRKWSSIGFVPHAGTTAAAEPTPSEDAPDKPVGILYYSSGGEYAQDVIYRPSKNPEVFTFTPPAEPDFAAPPPPKNVREWLDRALVPTEGSDVTLAALTDAAVAYFGSATPAQRGFRIGGRASPIPTFYEVVEEGGRRQISRARVGGKETRLIRGHMLFPITGADTVADASRSKAWDAPHFMPISPFPLEPACLRDVAEPEEIFRESNVVVMRGALGVGKSELCVSLLANGGPAVLVANRILLLEELAESIRAAGSDVLFYRNFQGLISPPAGFRGVLVICADSLSRCMFRATGWKPETLVVDECESVFAAFAGQCAKRDIAKIPKAANDGNLIVTAHEVFVSLVKHTRRCLFADAAAEQSSVDYVRMLRRDVRPLDLDRVPPPRSVDLHETPAAWEAAAFETIESETDEGFAVAFASNSKADVHAFNAKLRERGYRTCVITADGFDNGTVFTPRSFKEAAAADIHVLAWSPKIGVGSSYTPKDGATRYRVCLGLFSPASAGAQDAVQALFRVREVTRFIVCVKATPGKTPLPPAARTIPKVLAWMSETARQLSRTSDALLFDAVTGAPSPYALLVAKRLLEQALSSTKEGFERELLRRLAENGATLGSVFPAKVGERRTIEGVREAADAAHAAKLAAVDLTDHPDRYTPEERLFDEARAIAVLAGEDGDQLPPATAARAVAEKWLKKREVLALLIGEKARMMTDLPESIGGSIREVLAFSYVADVGRIRAVDAMRAALPAGFALATAVGSKLNPEAFLLYPAAIRERLAKGLFAGAGLVVEKWQIASSLWDAGGEIVRVKLSS